MSLEIQFNPLEYLIVPSVILLIPLETLVMPLEIEYPLENPKSLENEKPLDEQNKKTPIQDVELGFVFFSYNIQK